MFSKRDLEGNFTRTRQASLRLSIARLFISICLLVLSPFSLIAMEWRGLVPLHSTRSDVEKLLGRPSSSGEFVSSYELKDEFAEIVFAKGPPCGNTLVDIWQVPRDTVITIRVAPKHKFDLSMVQDNRGYIRTIDLKEKGVSYYTNEENGIRYTLNSEVQISREYIVSIDYLPRQSDNRQRCSSLSRADVGIQSIPTFERYGNISSSMEKAILDNFAIQLLQDKRLQGYVVVYVDRAAKRKEAQSRIRFIKNYLTNVRRVPKRRVISKEGGQRADAGVELYLVPRDQPGPSVERKKIVF